MRGEKMAIRNLLHKTKLEDFKQWLIKQGWIIQEPKGFYEVLRVSRDKETIIIFEKLDSKEHYTVQDNSLDMVRAYLKQR